MERNKLAKLVLLLLALPFAAYILINCAADYIPTNKSYQKTPDQFEAAFNEQMAKYGMSIDIDSVNFTYGSGTPYKIVPVHCEDNSVIEFTYYPSSKRSNSMIRGLEFAQTIQGTAEERIYLTPILKFLIREFRLSDANDANHSLDDEALSLQQALDACDKFTSGTDEKFEFLLSPKEDQTVYASLERYDREQDILVLFMNLED